VSVFRPLQMLRSRTHALGDRLRFRICNGRIKDVPSFRNGSAVGQVEDRDLAFEVGIKNTTKCLLVKRQGLFRCTVSISHCEVGRSALDGKINEFATSLVATKAIQ
jgi:hypothetical protein